MSANLEWRWDYVGPNASASVFIHGYGNRQAVAYSAVVYAGSGAGVISPLGRVLFTEGDTVRHVDGTIGRIIAVGRPMSGSPCLPMAADGVAAVQEEVEEEEIAELHRTHMVDLSGPVLTRRPATGA
jgi:hypothetical protein